VCGGNFYVASSGLLEGMKATTHWSLVPEFARAFPRVKLCPDEMVVDNGTIILGGGITAYFDVGLHILARLEGQDFSRRCVRFLLVDPVRPRQWIYSGDSEIRDADVIRAEAWLEGHLGERISVVEWALSVGVGERTFNRKFHRARQMSPAEYLRKRRIRKACDLLECTLSAWENVTESCGYEDPASFRRLFRKETGLTPKNWRDRFSVSRPR
jgi:transcriptional regulator GlxA family with amidase domain